MIVEAGAVPAGDTEGQWPSIGSCILAEGQWPSIGSCILAEGRRVSIFRAKI